jgi:hypothetical protein
VLSMDPQFSLAHAFVFYALVKEGKFPEALEEVEGARADRREDFVRPEFCARGKWHAGDEASLSHPGEYHQSHWPKQQRASFNRPSISIPSDRPHLIG